MGARRPRRIRRRRRRSTSLGRRRQPDRRPRHVACRPVRAESRRRATREADHRDSWCARLYGVCRRRADRRARRPRRRNGQHARCRGRLPRRAARRLRARPRPARRAGGREPVRRALLPRAGWTFGNSDLGGAVSHRVAVIAGDGAGPEVVAEARKAVDALGLDLTWHELPWGTDHYHETGAMMPADGVQQVREFDAVLLGAVGHPSVPDHITLWGLLLPLRQGLDLYANLRPARLLDGVPSKLEGRPSVDMLFVRENTEGEYSGVGGRAHQGLTHEVGIETAVFTREGVRRVVKYAFELAEQRRRVLTSATKSNASRYGYVLWDEVAEEVQAEHPDVKLERVLVDALAARMVGNPSSLDVVVASNLFGDVLTDIAAVLQGGMGMAASASLAPGIDTTPIFEPVHGSAPDIAGRGIANPMGAIWSAALMLDALGEAEASARLLRALEEVCREGPRTGDVGGSAGTSDVGDAVAARV